MRSPARWCFLTLLLELGIVNYMNFFRDEWKRKLLNVILVLGSYYVFILSLVIIFFLVLLIAVRPDSPPSFGEFVLQSLLFSAAISTGPLLYIKDLYEGVTISGSPLLIIPWFIFTDIYIVLLLVYRRSKSKAVNKQKRNTRQTR